VTSVPLSVLDLAPVPAGSTSRQALADTIALARSVEELGYGRFWVAEHHGMPGVASSAPAVLIGAIAAATSTIRVGSGGVMLPNHAPLVVAEQFGTLASLHPGRIDLGLGRAPGSDPITADALRRDPAAGDRFPHDVLELLHYFDPAEPGQTVRAVPGAGLDVPVWILGSSLFGAELAAHLGLPYAFASHFAPQAMPQAVALYRARFRPSARLGAPYVLLGVNVVAAETDDEARRLFTSAQQAFVNLRRGTPGPLPPPVDGYVDRLGPADRAVLAQVLATAVVGSPGTVRDGLAAFAARTGADELMVTTQVYDHAARLRSYAIVADVAGATADPVREPVAAASR
jgi:luciferase family oxidoreductase group 1